MGFAHGGAVRFLTDDDVGVGVDDIGALSLYLKYRAGVEHRPIGSFLFCIRS